MTPAAFWITNPDNCLAHNHAMGNYGFGYWYRMEKSALGSNIQFTNVKPQTIPLLWFFNNTACHNGRYALWVFEFYFPNPGPAVFDTLIACCNLRGFESGDTGLIQLVNSVLVHNHLSNVEMLLNPKENVATSLRYDPRSHDRSPESKHSAQNGSVARNRSPLWVRGNGRRALVAASGTRFAKMCMLHYALFL